MAHTADLRIEAWAPRRERCLGEAVSGLVESFAAAPLPAPTGTAEYELSGEDDEDLLVSLLDEVIYRMETKGEIPVSTDVLAMPAGLRVRSAVADAGSVVPIGAIPKAVSLHELRFAHASSGWECSVTIDV